MGKDRIVMNRRGKHHRELVQALGSHHFRDSKLPTSFPSSQSFQRRQHLTLERELWETQLINLEESLCTVRQEKKDEMEKAQLANNANSAAQLHFAKRGL